MLNISGNAEIQNPSTVFVASSLTIFIDKDSAEFCNLL